MLSKNEEDYLKGLYYLTVQEKIEKVGTNQLAARLDVTPASTNNMLKKLKSKNLVDYKRYGKLELTAEGQAIAVQLIRKHRLWETFLYEKLEFTWDEVHAVAEQLEHIRSEKLIQQLDHFLGYPKIDPHGDPIPDAEGNIVVQKKRLLAEVEPGNHCRLVAVKDSSAPFLQYVSDLGLSLKSRIRVIEQQVFDNSMRIEIDGRQEQISEKFSRNVYVHLEE